MCQIRVKFCLLLFWATCDLFSYVSSGELTTIPAESTIVSIDSTTTPIPPFVSTCDNLSVMQNIDILRISGTWYEMARKSYEHEGYYPDLQCISMSISYNNGTAFVYQSLTPVLNVLNVEITNYYIALYNTTNVSGYKIVYTNYNYIPIPTYKILDTDYENYLVVCSYIPQWEQSAAAFVYFRDRNVPSSEIYSLVFNASSKWVDFNGLNLVYQGPNCNAVSRVLPMGMTIFVLLFSIYILKLIH